MRAESFIAYVKGSAQWLILAVLVFPGYSIAQSLDDCMQGKGQQAITICKQLLDNGSRNPTVYYKLASEHYQSNNSKTALELINQGLALHPDDENLNRLKDYVTIGTREEQDLARSAEKNQLRIKLGQLKITCRTKQGSVGISACQSYLSQTNADKGVIEKRLATLQQDSVDPTETIIADTTGSASTQDTTLRPELNTAQRARRELVSRVQSTLNNLGFIAGTPDGISGERTRQALALFYQDTGFPERTTIDQTTLVLLENAASDKAIANSVLEQSRSARDAGDITLALQRLDEAEAASPLLIVSKNYRNELLALRAVAVVEAIPTLQADEPEKQIISETPANNTPDNNEFNNEINNEINNRGDSEDSSNNEMETLIAQLQTLELKLQMHESTLRKNLGEIRAMGAIVEPAMNSTQ